VLARQQDRVVAVVGLDDLEAGLLEAGDQRREDQAVVVDDHDQRLFSVQSSSPVPPIVPQAPAPAQTASSRIAGGISCSLVATSAPA
jgi:hypothetical protein